MKDDAYLDINHGYEEGIIGTHDSEAKGLNGFTGV